MPAGSRFIGFTARAAAACFHAACRSLHRLTVRRRVTAGFIPPRKCRLSRAPSRTTSARALSGRAACPGFLPSSRHHQGASTDRETSQASLRSVHRRSQPHDGLLRTLAPGLVSSPSRVQGSSRSGGSLSAQRLRLVAAGCLLAVATTGARRTLRVTASTPVVPRPRGVPPRGGACSTSR